MEERTDGKPEMEVDRFHRGRDENEERNDDDPRVRQMQ